MTDPRRKQTLTVTEGVPAPYVIVITARHDKDRKAYRTTAVLNERANGFLRSTYIIFGENPGHIDLPAEATGRFNEAKFNAYCDATFDSDEAAAAIASLTALAEQKALANAQPVS